MARPRNTCGMYLRSYVHLLFGGKALAPLHGVLVPVTSEALPHGHGEVVVKRCQLLLHFGFHQGFRRIQLEDIPKGNSKNMGLHPSVPTVHRV